jgi:hypothetical protein
VLLVGAVGALAVGWQLHVATHWAPCRGLVTRHGTRLRSAPVAGSLLACRDGTVTVRSDDPAILVVPESRHASLRSSVLHRDDGTDLQVAENYIKLLIMNKVNIKTPRKVRFI